LDRGPIALRDTAGLISAIQGKMDEGTASVLLGRAMESSMKFTVPGMLITALLTASPALAQYGSPGNSSTPGASVTKDDSWSVATRVRKHVESHKQKKHITSSVGGTENGSWSVATRTKNHVESHKQKKQQGQHSKTTNSKAQTTGSGGSSVPGASINKDDTTQRSR
jgi:hypothetical protein